MPHPALLVVTGASGVGKTTLVRGLERLGLPGIACHYFDSIGVPSPEEMIERYGSGEGWQRAMAVEWLRRLSLETAPGSLAVLDGQVRPSFVIEAGRVHPFAVLEILLVDCSHAVRDDRLRTTRGQPGLATTEMAAWAAYLRGQADTLGLPRLDTTNTTLEEAVESLANHATRLLELGR